MNLLIACLFIATLLPYLAKIPLALAMSKAAGGYDNHYPREQGARLTGFGARAYGAHQNSFESLLVFAIGTLAAIATNSISTAIEVLAVVHLIARGVYHAMYLLDRATPRTLSWAVGYLSALSMLGLSFHF